MEYRANPLSRKDIRNFANLVRKALGIENKLFFSVVRVFEFLSYKVPFTFEILSKAIMGSKCGETFPQEKHILLREDIYDLAYQHDPFARSTLCHELFHLLFHSGKNVSLCRNERELSKRKMYEDPEWQANCFAGEILVPKSLVRGMDIDTVMKECRVSVSMASYQLRQYGRE